VRDPQRYPLPWGGEVPAEPRAEPEYMAFLTDEELASLHAAMVARQSLLGRTSRLP
jgi:hypothetical protein